MKKMKILAAPDSFKGSITATEVCETVERAAADVWGSVEMAVVPVADGGEGTVDAIYTSKGGELIRLETEGSVINDRVSIKYLGIGDTAVMEMAQPNGLEKMVGRLEPRYSNTFGTGQMILDALDKGFRKILIGIGGSATNDGGCGAMQALGVVFKDKEGKVIKRMCGSELINVGSIDTSGLDKRVGECEFTVMCDVDNPLTGDQGAIYIYGPQKGAVDEIKEELEAGMKNYEKVLNDTFGKDIGSMAGSGAAGGLGSALLSYLNAKMVPGIDKVLDFCDFDEKAEGADLIITGEGKIDSQTLHGKAIKGICERAVKNGVPVVVFAGLVDITKEEMGSMGIKDGISLIGEGMTVEYSIAHGKELLYKRAFDYFSSVK